MNRNEIEKAVAILKRGGLVAFPTETVYGLGADAANPDAVRKLYTAKGRPADHPVIVHLADAALLPQWASDVTSLADKLAQSFWPGPLTLILRCAPGVSAAVTGGQDTIGLRVPSHPVAQALLQSFGGGIAAPSANRFGHVSATTAQHVRDEFGDSVALVLDGGQSEVGIESTIVDATGAQPVLLRPGKISIGQIEQITGLQVAALGAASPRAPGTLPSHYAPDTPLILLERAPLLERAQSLLREDQRVAVLALGAPDPAATVCISAPPDTAAYAHNMYANLRKLDAAKCDVILVERPPQTPEWAAINDRLSRAAGSQQK